MRQACWLVRTSVVDFWWSGGGQRGGKSRHDTALAPTNVDNIDKQKERYQQKTSTVLFKCDSMTPLLFQARRFTGFPSHNSGLEGDNRQVFGLAGTIMQ